jgi:hypothetical protein
LETWKAGETITEVTFEELVKDGVSYMGRVEREAKEEEEGRGG